MQLSQEFILTLVVVILDAGVDRFENTERGHGPKFAEFVGEQREESPSEIYNVVFQLLYETARKFI
jgi:hypothetical protein